MSAQITPIGCTGACDGGRRPCTCIPDLPAEEPAEQPLPWWEVTMFWLVVLGLVAVIAIGWAWQVGSV